MICKPCAAEADMLKGHPHAKELHEKWRKAKMGHDQCEGCDCAHKNVGTCIPVEQH